MIKNVCSLLQAMARAFFQLQNQCQRNDASSEQTVD